MMDDRESLIKKIEPLDGSLHVGTAWGFGKRHATRDSKRAVEGQHPGTGLAFLSTTGHSGRMMGSGERMLGMPVIPHLFVPHEAVGLGCAG